ncbi:hypothetical protein KI387_037779, partial [Taxus chinensis]
TSQAGCSQSGGGQETCSVVTENLVSFAGLSIPMFSSQDQIGHDITVSILTASVALGCLRFWDEMAKRDMLDQKLNRKFVHISIGLIFMLLWPLFSTGPQAPYLAALAPGVNIFRMIGLGLGILKKRSYGQIHEQKWRRQGAFKGTAVLCLLTNIHYYFILADLARWTCGNSQLMRWRWYLFYFASFGYYVVSLKMLLGALFVSTAATIIESLPISTELDDNLTVSLVSAVVGCLVF